MDHQELKQLEDDLWEAADQLRANSKLTASEYSMPVLGLIFLRHATTRFNELLPGIESSIPARATGSLREKQIRLGFEGKAAIYLPEKARYDHLAALPSSQNLAIAIREAMVEIEDTVTDQQGKKLLEGALPKDYLGLELDLLAELIKIFNRPALQTAQGDVFGRIYEYFLNQFAQSGAQEGGEFFTPPSLVKLIVNVIEPDHGTVLDPACGSAGMFVQTGHFIEEARHQNTSEVNIRFYGQEKADLNSKLARMNLAVHGLEGNIRIGNTFYDDHHGLVGACDFVMANPPFNVDGVAVAKIKSQVGDRQSGRLPFGLPGVATKSRGKKGDDSGETVSNANSLWIQYFYSYLNDQGRAGFVMASSASDAGNKDKEIRQKLVITGHVDVMVAIGPKFFYTRSLPCTLWFFDKGKPKARQDTVLMIDARNHYTVVSARSHVFTDEQLANLTAITWLYRSEQAKYTALLAQHQGHALAHLQALAQRLADDAAPIAALRACLRSSEQQSQESQVNELQAGVELPLTVLPQSPVFLQPGKAALDHPTLGNHRKLVQLAAFGNLHRDLIAQRLAHALRKRLARVPAVTQHTSHPSQAPLATPQRLQRSQAIRHIGRAHCHCMRQSLCIHGNVALDARDLFARVISLQSRCVGVLHALRINNQERWTGVAPQSLSGHANLIFLKPAPTR
jgi:type I restriction enzyme M protein